jgi:hypothetical protein
MKIIIDLLQELRLGRRWITNNADVNVPTKMHAFCSLLVHTSHELKQQTLFHNLMPVDGRRDTLDQSRVDMVGFNHTLQFLEFRLGKGFGKGQTVLF